MLLPCLLAHWSHSAGKLQFHVETDFLKLCLFYHCTFNCRFILNPNANSKEELEHMRFIGILMGIAIRTKKPLNLHLAPTVWKQIVNIPLLVEDIEEVDFALFVAKMKFDCKGFRVLLLRSPFCCL